MLEKCHAWPDGSQACTITTRQASVANVAHYGSPQSTFCFSTHILHVQSAGSADFTYSFYSDTCYYLPPFQSHCYSVHGDMSTYNSCHSQKYSVFQKSKVNVICMLRGKLQLENCGSEFQEGITN